MITTFTILASSGFADSTVVPQWAQEKKPVKVACYFGAGGSFVADRDAINVDPNYHILGRVDFTLTPKLSLWLGADYNFSSFHDFPALSTDEKKRYMINFAADFKISTGLPGPGINPYLFVGIGGEAQSSADSIYNIPGDTLNGRLVNVPGRSGGIMEVGGGAVYKKFFIQGRYIGRLSGKSGGYIPITAGVKF